MKSAMASLKEARGVHKALLQQLSSGWASACGVLRDAGEERCSQCGGDPWLNDWNRAEAVRRLAVEPCGRCPGVALMAEGLEDLKAWVTPGLPDVGMRHLPNRLD
ncbi:hypothetical protein NDU88_000697 [Pleurodeles waltl]|uniref:Uncharacterized protein n=1 Tax=Pleurodeles waltl TaxID=8319 RepID=A0AAV7VY94_PLEWA|nr:hypothetical protein NDU88_000697 [Pleurodeles waltl]